MNKKTIWVIDDVSASREMIIHHLHRFEESVRVIPVRLKHPFGIPHPKQLWCKRDGDVTPDIIISELATSDERAIQRPKVLFEHVAGKGRWRIPSTIQMLKQFATEHKVGAIAVVSRCIDAFSNHPDLTIEEAEQMNRSLRDKLIEHGITTIIPKREWEAHKHLLGQFVEAALAR